MPKLTVQPAGPVTERLRKEPDAIVVVPTAAEAPSWTMLPAASVVVNVASPPLAVVAPADVVLLFCARDTPFTRI